jgi:biopolymer transport protein ExbB
MSFQRFLTSLLAAATIVAAPGAALLAPQVAHAEETPAASAQPAASAAPAALPAAAPMVSKETVANPYGLDALWKQGDFVARGTLIILLIMSMGSWYIVVIKLFEQYKLLQQAKNMQKTFWSAGSIDKGIATLLDDSPFRYIAETGTKAVAQYKSAKPDTIDLNSWAIMAIQRATDSVQNRMQDGLTVLATVGSTAPFVGLFGTVWGIYHALTAIGIAGQASIDKVAGPVGEALIMTAIGLAVAVPAVLTYNWLVRRNKLVMEDVRGFSAELHAALMIGRGA